MGRTFRVIGKHKFCVSPGYIPAGATGRHVTRWEAAESKFFICFLVWQSRKRVAEAHPWPWLCCVIREQSLLARAMSPPSTLPVTLAGRCAPHSSRCSPCCRHCQAVPSPSATAPPRQSIASEVPTGRSVRHWQKGITHVLLDKAKGFGDCCLLWNLNVFALAWSHDP